MKKYLLLIVVVLGVILVFGSIPAAEALGETADKVRYVGYGLLLYGVYLSAKPRR